jgi:exopolysaccharide biosynthesis polyprenyl glycosylphosphotransferase
LYIAPLSNGMVEKTPQKPLRWSRPLALRRVPRGESLANSSARASIAHGDISLIWEAGRGADRAREASGYPVRLRRNAFFRRSLIIVDVLAAYVALLCALLLIDSGSVHLRLTTLAIAPFVVLASKIIGLYDRDQDVLRKTTIEEVPSILNLAVLYALAVWLLEMFLFRGFLARPQVFALAVATFVLVTVGRAVARTIALAVTPAERCLIIGNAKDATRIANKLTAARSVNAEVVGRVALWGEDADSGGSGVAARLGDVGALPQVLREHEVERVIIAPEAGEQEEMLDVIRLVKALNMSVSVLPRLLEVVGSSSTFDEIDGIWLLGVRQFGLSRSSECLKRGMDIAGSAVTLIALAPLLLMLTIAVKIDSHGPVLFRQSRIGRRGQQFWMLKFRSMDDGADQVKDALRQLNEVQGGLFKISEDPRITRVGRFLRRTSLDELPQLLNVLRGDMSLVGPRPLVEDEDALIEGWRRRRLAVKPGMTGQWQIFGSSRIPMQEMVKIDYMYGANWSLWLDLKILLRTIPYILSRRGL